MTLQTLLEHRRSVRHYADTPIDPETVRRCLKTAQLAPSSSNMQLYEFYHITDPAVLKRERGNIRRNSPPEKHAKRIAASEGYYGKLMPFLYARCLGFLGGLRWLISRSIGLFRPMQREVTEADVRTVVHKC